MSDRPDTTNSGDEDMLAAELALRVLPPKHEAILSKRAADDPAFAGKVSDWRSKFSGLDDEFAPIVPPSEVKKRLDARLFATTAAAKPAFWQRIGFWRGATVGAGLLAAIAIAYPALTPDIAQPIAIATLPSENADNTFSIVYNRAEKSLSVSRAGTQALVDNDFELWAIVGDNPPVSLGVLARQGGTITQLDDNRAELLSGAVTLAVSLEPTGGSTTGAPTGPVLAAGALQSL